MIKTFDEYLAENEKTMRYHDIVETYNGVYFKENAEIGDGATVSLYTDRHAYDIIKRTPCTLTLRRCKATLVPEFKPEFIVGGFCAHCTNQEEQRYTYEENPNGEVITAHWSKKNNRFYYLGMVVHPNRREYYDYNY